MPNARQVAALAVTVLAYTQIAFSQCSNVNQHGFTTTGIMNTIRYPKTDLTVVSAHRGYHALPSGEEHGVPENSLQSILAAACAGIEVVELDVRDTKDHVPILSHDTNWGRETNVEDANNQQWDPWTNGQHYNPGLYDLTLNDVMYRQQDNGQYGHNGILLRDSVGFNWSAWAEHPPTLKQALDFITNEKLTIVLALDVKNASDIQDAWWVVATHAPNAFSESYYNIVFFKADAATYPNEGDFERAFSNHWAGGGPTDVNVINYMPVYQTSYSGNAYDQIGRDSGKHWYVGAEINTKENGTYWETLSNWAGTTSRGKTTVANFNPQQEWLTQPNSSMSTWQYFNSDGSCCSTLKKYLFGGGNGHPPDYDDRRQDWLFLNGIGAVSFITSDNAVNLADWLAQNGKRNIWHLQTGN